MIKTALLTIGASPVADAAIRALAEHSALQYVVFSRKKRKVSLLHRIREYGFRYTLQALISRILYLIFRIINKGKSKASVSIDWTDDMSAEDVSKLLVGVDVVVCCLFNRILDRSFIEGFDYCINIHPSLLPEYRGPEPIYWGLLNNESTFGLTVHYITERIDDGDVILQSHCGRPIFPLTFLVERKLASKVDGLVQDILTQVASGRVVASKQKDGFYLPSPTLKNIKKVKSELPNESTQY